MNYNEYLHSSIILSFDIETNCLVKSILTIILSSNLKQLQIIRLVHRQISLLKHECILSRTNLWNENQETYSLRLFFQLLFLNSSQRTM